MFCLLVLYSLLILLLIFRLVCQNRNPENSLLWIMVLIFIPILGVVFYATLGCNLRGKNMIFSKSTYLNNIGNFSQISENQQKLMQILYRNSGTIPYESSGINLYSSGKSTFEAMFATIENAEKQIDIEFFIIRNDRIGKELQKRLIERAENGVKIRLVYDFWGSYRLIYNRSFIRQMRRAGIEIRAFLPLKFKRNALLFNHRNHRKILTVDDKIGFTGGLNIADRYYYGNRLGQWRDTFASFEGEAVRCLQRIFAADWAFAGNEIFQEKENIFNNNISENAVQIVHSSPDTDCANIAQALQAAILNAKKSVCIQTPYFVPTNEVFEALRTAAASGTEVKLMISARSDSKILDACSASYFEPLLAAGVRIFRYCNGFLHCKTCIIDSEISIIGSTNIDIRSLEKNFEINAFIYGRKIADKFLQLFDCDLQCCTEIKLAEWQRRSSTKKFAESAARLVSGLL